MNTASNIIEQTPTGKFRTDSLAMNEARLILAEKRTSLSVLRTGIAVFVLPLTVLSVLIATSKYYEMMQVLHLITPLLVISAGLIVLGLFLITRAVARILRYDKMIQKLKEKSKAICECMD